MLLPFKLLQLMHVTLCVHLACTSQLQQSCKINHIAGSGSIKHPGRILTESTILAGFTIVAGSTVLHPNVRPSESSHQSH